MGKRVKGAGWAYTGCRETPEAFRAPSGPDRRKLLVEAEATAGVAAPGTSWQDGTQCVCPSPVNSPQPCPSSGH